MRNPAKEKLTKKGSAAGSWVKARTKSGKKKTGANGDARTRLDKLLADEDWTQAQPLLHRELLHDPTSHWLWMMLSMTYYEQRDYETALTCAQRAVEFAPHCSLALWHYAGSLSMCYQEDSALAIYSLIVAKDLEEVAHGDCGEGMGWAMQLVNDVHYRMGCLYKFLGRDAQARVSFEKYLHNRAHGVGSIYDEKEVRRYLAELPEASG